MDLDHFGEKIYRRSNRATVTSWRNGKGSTCRPDRCMAPGRACGSAGRVTRGGGGGGGQHSLTITRKQRPGSALLALGAASPRSAAADDSFQCTAIRAERQPRGTTPAESVRLATFRPGPRVESRLRRAAACVPPPAQHRVTVPLQLQLYIVESTTTSPPAAAVTSSRRGARGPRARNHRTPNIAHQASQKYKQLYAYPAMPIRIHSTILIFNYPS
ncbi:hypothetical protein JYU34_011617 [Plutella xylostella]|uniref:Uncharacterized protein n=1 Tax=Plutella xylostella TaxID=51655 RepID=A0ABQ7QHF1_PLUXY|nr:hypothetical protein JYU34_011617 [Plutella xylostella]